MLGADVREVGGWPINPAARAVLSDPILIEVSVIDGLATLVRGRKLPIFSIGGLPHLELAAQIAVPATVRDELAQSTAGLCPPAQIPWANRPEIHARTPVAGNPRRRMTGQVGRRVFPRSSEEGTSLQPLRPHMRQPEAARGACAAEATTAG